MTLMTIIVAGTKPDMKKINRAGSSCYDPHEPVVIVIQGMAMAAHRRLNKSRAIIGISLSHGRNGPGQLNRDMCFSFSIHMLDLMKW